jgi:hypothetical protein
MIDTVANYQIGKGNYAHTESITLVSVLMIRNAIFDLTKQFIQALHTSWPIIYFMNQIYVTQC